MDKRRMRHFFFILFYCLVIKNKVHVKIAEFNPGYVMFVMYTIDNLKSGQAKGQFIVPVAGTMKNIYIKPELVCVRSW